jgi:hypothetical protein
MTRVDENPNAIRAATTPGLFESLQSYAVQMEKIQRSLEVIHLFICTFISISILILSAVNNINY